MHNAFDPPQQQSLPPPEPRVVLRQAVRTWKIPLYYAGIEARAHVRERGGSEKAYALNRAYEIELELRVPARGVNWYTVENAQ